MLWSEGTKALTGQSDNKENRDIAHSPAQAETQLNPGIVALVRFMARCAAEHDYAALLAKEGTVRQPITDRSLE